MASDQILDQGIEFLCAAFDKRIDDDRRKIYASLLADLPDAVFKAAVKHCAATNTFFPVPGEIRAAAAHLGKLCNLVPSGDEAWSELVNRAHAPVSQRVYCQEYLLIDQRAYTTTNEYWQRIHDLKDHEASCKECRIVVTEYQFSHPLVGEVAARLGWPSRFWSENIGVDRGRFIKTYEGEVERRTGEAILLPAVRDYVDEQRLITGERQAVFETGEAAEIQSQIRRLTYSMGG